MPKPFSAGDEVTASDANTLWRFGGDGSDGSKTVSSSENIDAGSSNFVVKNYTDLTIDAGQTLGLTNVASSGTIMILKVQGDCEINGTIDVDGDGNSSNSGDGYGAWSVDTGGTVGGNGATSSSGGGGGGGAHKNVGIAGSAGSGTGTPGSGGAGGTKLVGFDGYVNKWKRAYFVAVGSGGGKGGTGDSGNAGGDGGNGGGAVIIEVSGDLTFGASSVITADGTNGTDGTDNLSESGGGGGGGGSGGQIFILYNGTLTDSGLTTTVTGGAGGAGGDGTGSNDGGAGGAGGDGDYFISKNDSNA